MMCLLLLRIEVLDFDYNFVVSNCLLLSSSWSMRTLAQVLASLKGSYLRSNCRSQLPNCLHWFVVVELNSLNS